MRVRLHHRARPSMHSGAMFRTRISQTELPDRTSTHAGGSLSGQAEHSIDIGGAAEVLRRTLPGEAEVLLVLGSGLGHLAAGLEGGTQLSFDEVPGFPPSAVAGHAGFFAAGLLEGRKVLVQSGRFHLYEGHPPDVVVAPIRIAARLGIKRVLLTNASGGIRPDLGAGAIVLIDDHLNFTGTNVLAGRPGEGEARFPDMSRPYDPELQARALDAARSLGLPLSRGCYGGVLGPSYETPTEIDMLKKLGADVVGMSTVAEVLAARALGMRVLALSLVTNRAASRTGPPLSHAEVLEGARTGSIRMEALVRRILRDQSIGTTR